MYKATTLQIKSLRIALCGCGDIFCITMRYKFINIF